MKKNKTIIAINASFIRKLESGIGQVTANFLKNLMVIFGEKERDDSPYQFILYLQEDTAFDFEVPRNFLIKTIVPKWKRDDLLRQLIWEKQEVVKMAKKDKANAFLSLYQSATKFPRGLKIKHIMLVHDVIPDVFPEYLNNIRKKVYWKCVKEAIKRADKIVAISKHTRDDLMKYLEISYEKISVRYIDCDESYKKQVSQNDAMKILKFYSLTPGYILAGGGMEFRKNIKGVIGGYKTLIDKNGKNSYLKKIPMLVIYGKLMPQLAPIATDAEKIAKEFGVEDRVCFLGQVPQKSMSALFQKALFFIYPSFYEGFGLPVLEAMNSGIPVITSSTSSIPEVGGNAVMYCDPNDPGKIYEAMEKIMKDEKNRELLISKGMNQAANFSWKKFTEKTIDDLNKILES